jgi:hypothetical protein
MAATVKANVILAAVNPWDFLFFIIPSSKPCRYDSTTTP